jgi:hypothetical protein
MVVKKYNNLPQAGLLLGGLVLAVVLLRPGGGLGVLVRRRQAVRNNTYFTLVLK